jgi:hypothetical protein
MPSGCPIPRRPRYSRSPRIRGRTSRNRFPWSPADDSNHRHRYSILRLHRPLSYSRCSNWHRHRPSSRGSPQRREPSARFPLPDRAASLSCPHPSSPPSEFGLLRWISSSRGRLVDNVFPFPPRPAGKVNLRCRAPQRVHALRAARTGRKPPNCWRDPCGQHCGKV